MEDTQEQLPNSFEEVKAKHKAEWLAPYQFKKGQSGNPGGRPIGQSVKARAKAMLASMNEEEFQEFIQGIDKKIIWEMAEGKAKQDVEHSGTMTISQVLDQLDYGYKIEEQTMEDKPSL